MIEKKKKKCKGTGKAKGFESCGEPCYTHRYGLCRRCYSEWILTTPEGKEVLKKSIIKASKKTKEEEKKERRRKKQELNINSNKFNFYKTTAWKWCSRYVLLYYADSNNIVSCATSPELSYHITDKNIHCGHYIKLRDSNSTNYSTALLFENLAPQSNRDNTQLGGKPEVLKGWLISKHGEDKIEALNRTKRVAYKLDKYTLFEISEKYKKLFNDLLAKRGIENPWKK